MTELEGKLRCLLMFLMFLMSLCCLSDSIASCGLIFRHYYLLDLVFLLRDKWIYMGLCKFHAFTTCLFAVGLCKSFLMEGVSNHDRTIGED